LLNLICFLISCQGIGSLTIDHFFKTDGQVDKALERNPLNDWYHRFKAHSRPFSLDEEGFLYYQSTAF